MVIENGCNVSSRRGFLGKVAGSAVAGTVALAPSALGNSAPGSESASTPTEGVANSRVVQAFNLRVGLAAQDASIGVARNVSNGDDLLYADRGGTFTKGLPHDSFGRVDLNAYQLFKTALESGQFADFERIPMGGTGKLNDPQGGLAFDLETPDNVQFGQPQVPPAPPMASDQGGTELLEHYWGALLRDVSFTDYETNAVAAQAAAELGAQTSYTGPRDSHGKVTPDLLFRGGFAGETAGPYVSQFLITPTNFGAHPMDQRMVSYLPGIDYMTSFGDWLSVQNGNYTGLKNQVDSALRYRRNGRDLAAYTHLDVLFQAYFMAFLGLAGVGAPLNPGNPYNGSKSENGFGTFGGPDFAGALTAVATKALNAAWYQKWFVHLRPRPEAAGGLVHLVKSGQGSKTDVQPSKVVLNSVALQQTFNKYGSWLLPQAFPEGSPMHPAYPTGHGTVGGACITLLKFFFDGNYVLPNPMAPTSDGMALAPYTGAAAGQLTVNGELNKLGHNITFGHGVHAGIHWRSDSDTSLLLGEAVALSYLRDRAKTYNEPFTIRLTKFDGTTATVSNLGNP